MEYLTKEQMLLIHSLIIEETTGAHGVRDHHALLSLEKAPAQSFGGKELYVDIFSKAAVYVREIIKTHIFIDGNKRTALMAAATFLELNGYKLDVRRGEMVKFAVSVAINKFDLDKIAKWLKKNSKSVD